jgi:hypothetical protein
MILYYVGDDAQTVLERGFLDGEGFYHEGILHRGVWLFDRPLEREQEQVAGSRTIVVDIPDHVAARHEWLQEGSSYRKFLIPAEIANGYLETG